MAPTADDIDHRIGALPSRDVGTVRGVRRACSRELRGAPAEEVLALAEALVARHRWVAYELVYHHPGALAGLDRERVERFGRGLDGWGATDAFGRYVSGPAWQRRQLPDAAVLAWARSDDRWWRRAALVSTVPLNLRAAGGRGDAPRTLAICCSLVADRDDMVVKALSWALRALVRWSPDLVRDFLDDHGDAVAARVRREVGHQLAYGRKA